jgi:hypothetical protein
MGFFGGASGKEKKKHEAGTQLAEQRFGDIYSGTMEGANVWGARSRERAGTMDTRSDWMWDQLGDGGTWGIDSYAGAGGGGGGPAYRGDPNSIWGNLRDTGDLTGGDWEKARGVYNEYADTGGWDEDRKRDFRARAIAGTDMYDPSQQAGSRVQGGWGGGGGQAGDLQRLKAISEMRRRGSFEAESEIASGVDEGRRWGASSVEGLGSKVQAGRITGQTKMDEERRRKHQAAVSRARHSQATMQAAMDANWGRRMQLTNQGYANANMTGGDLPYYQAAGNAAQGAIGARQTSFGQQQANQGWGSQAVGMVGGLAGAAGSAMTGIGALRPPVPGAGG